jgi:hypothetical protein
MSDSDRASERVRSITNKYIALQNHQAETISTSHKQTTAHQITATS